MYSQDKIDIAPQVYHQCGYAASTICMLGCPTGGTLYTWIENEGVQRLSRKALDNANTAVHPHPPPVEVKMNVVHHYFEFRESIKYVSEEIGCGRAGIYAWREKYLQGGTITPMNDKNIKPGILAEDARNSP